MMTETTYDPSIQISNIIKAVHNPEERKKWDKDIESA